MVNFTLYCSCRQYRFIWTKRGEVDEIKEKRVGSTCSHKQETHAWNIFISLPMLFFYTFTCIHGILWGQSENFELTCTCRMRIGQAFKVVHCIFMHLLLHFFSWIFVWFFLKMIYQLIFTCQPFCFKLVLILKSLSSKSIDNRKSL
jgi:hypothetical protein